MSIENRELCEVSPSFRTLTKLGDMLVFVPGKIVNQCMNTLGLKYLRATFQLTLDPLLVEPMR